MAIISKIMRKLHIKHIWMIVVIIPILMFTIPCLVIILWALFTFIFYGQAHWLFGVHGNRLVTLIIAGIAGMLPFLGTKIMEV